MHKREALKVLIEHTFILDEDSKVRLIDSIPKLTDEQVEQLGVLLANEKEIAISSSSKKLYSLNKAIKGLKA